MAKGKKCPVCKFPMYAQDEKYEPQGTWVVYYALAHNYRGFAPAGLHLYADALDNCNHAIQLDPENIVELYNSKGNILLRLNRHAEALEGLRARPPA